MNVTVTQDSSLVPTKRVWMWMSVPWATFVLILPEGSVSISWAPSTVDVQKDIDKTQPPVNSVRTLTNAKRDLILVNMTASIPLEATSVAVGRGTNRSSTHIYQEMRFAQTSTNVSRTLRGDKRTHLFQSYVKATVQTLTAVTSVLVLQDIN